VADVSPEEVARQLESHERRTDAVHQELGQRITQVARDTVPLAVYQQAQQTWSDTVKRLEREQEAEIQRLEREHARDIQAVRAEVKEIRERPQLTAGRFAVLATAVIALLALIVQAYGVLKGAR
jgi:polyribonucleotide nucleotidyltransferase